MLENCAQFKDLLEIFMSRKKLCQAVRGEKVVVGEVIKEACLLPQSPGSHSYSQNLQLCFCFSLSYQISFLAFNQSLPGHHLSQN